MQKKALKKWRLQVPPMARDREKSKEIVILLAGDTEIVNGHEVNTRQSCGVNRMRRKERQRKY